MFYYAADGDIKLVGKLERFIFESRLLAGDRNKYSRKEGRERLEREKVSSLER